MIADNIRKIQQGLPSGVKLVAVSKTKPSEDISKAYQAGQRIFGENKVQELVTKYHELPGDIQWHLIGHLQRNKVKYIAPFVSLIHSIDSLELLQEVNRQALRYNRIISCLLQVHIATEETKFGLNETELMALIHAPLFPKLQNVSICGLMGMATFTEDTTQIRSEFRHLTEMFARLKSAEMKDNPHFAERSMGMSSDYLLAVEEGSTMVRVGSMIFGKR